MGRRDRIDLGGDPRADVGGAPTRASRTATRASLYWARLTPSANDCDPRIHCPTPRSDFPADPAITDLELVVRVGRAGAVGMERTGSWASTAFDRAIIGGRHRAGIAVGE